MKWEVVMGLEVHAELSTKSKIFCGCSAAFGGEPNTTVCPICAGMPGTLPRLNRTVLEYAIRLGLALNCSITEYSKFDRKNYCYPDLPKAYQVSQLYAPICKEGYIQLAGGNRIGVRQIHMEEDAGKLIHEPRSGCTLMDFNRCGVPLLEIVSHPDFRTADEVNEYLKKLSEILLYLGISDCKMQEGSMRVDVNISVRRPGEPLGVRTELKNMNSFKAIARAIQSETERQIELLESGGRVVQETRRWDDEKGYSRGMRSKENAQDYRYFPDPDLLPIDLSVEREWMESIQKSLPELPEQKRERYTGEYGLTAHDAAILTGHYNISALFEEIAESSGQAKEAANLVTGGVMRMMNSTGTLAENLSVDGKKLAVLVGLVCEGKINRTVYNQVMEAVFVDDIEPEAYIAQKGLGVVSDGAVIADAVSEVLAANPDAVADYRSGKDKAFGFLMGQVMRKLGGKGAPDVIKSALTEGLAEG